MTVKEYVASKFTDIEQSLFNFIVQTFPEHILVQENEESEDILALLATLTKAFGNAKELILNLQTSHSIDDTYKKISDGYLEKNNKKILLPLVDSLNYHRMYSNLETDELINLLIKEKPFIQDYYNLYKNRGTIVVIDQIIKKFNAYLQEDINQQVEYNIIESNGILNIVFSALEEYLDFNVDPLVVAGNESLFIKKDTIIYDMLMKVKPAGITYNILMQYSAISIANTLSDRVVSRIGTENLLNPNIIVNSAYFQTEEPIIGGISTQDESLNYKIIIENKSLIKSYKLHVTDWHDENLLLNTNNISFPTNFEEARFKFKNTTTFNKNLITDTGSKIFVFSTFELLNQELPQTKAEYTALGNAPIRAIITGYRWQVITLSQYNAAVNKIDQIEVVQSTPSVTLYKVTKALTPDFSLRSQYASGSVALKYTEAIDQFFQDTKYFLLVEDIPGGISGNALRYGYYITEGFPEFSYSEVTLPIGTAIEINRTSTNVTDYNFENSFLGYYYFDSNLPGETKTTTITKTLDEVITLKVLADPIILNANAYEIPTVGGAVSFDINNPNNLTLVAKINITWQGDSQTTSTFFQTNIRKKRISNIIGDTELLNPFNTLATAIIKVTLFSRKVNEGLQSDESIIETEEVTFTILDVTSSQI
jgi:hypothetical protein